VRVLHPLATIGWVTTARSKKLERELSRVDLTTVESFAPPTSGGNRLLSVGKGDRLDRCSEQTTAADPPPTLLGKIGGRCYPECLAPAGADNRKAMICQKEGASLVLGTSVSPLKGGRLRTCAKDL